MFEKFLKSENAQVLTRKAQRTIVGGSDSVEEEAARKGKVAA